MDINNPDDEYDVGQGLAHKTHRTHWEAPPRKLRGKTFGVWVQVSEGRWKRIEPKPKEEQDDGS